MTLTEQLKQGKTLEEAVAYSLETVTISRAEYDYYIQLERLAATLLIDDSAKEKIEQLLKQKYNP